MGQCCGDGGREEWFGYGCGRVGGTGVTVHLLLPPPLFSLFFLNLLRFFFILFIFFFAKLNLHVNYISILSRNINRVSIKIKNLSLNIF